MTKREMAMLLARVADLDRRTLSDTIVETWHEAIGHLDYAIAVRALRIVARESVEIIKPAHIVKASRLARVEIERETRRAERQRALTAERKPREIENVVTELQQMQRQK